MRSQGSVSPDQESQVVMSAVGVVAGLLGCCFRDFANGPANEGVCYPVLEAECQRPDRVRSTDTILRSTLYEQADIPTVPAHSEW